MIVLENLYIIWIDNKIRKITIKHNKKITQLNLPWFNILVLVVLILFSSGCTKYLSNGKERVVNELTGQAVTSNILCLPEDKDLVKIYEKNKKKLDVDYESLSKCENFKPSNFFLFFSYILMTGKNFI